MGSLMTLISPICFSFALTAKNNVQRVVFGCFSFAMLASLVFTFSRGAWIGFMSAVMIYVFVKDIRLVIPCIIMAIILVVCVPSVGNRISYMLSPEYIESSLRGGRLVRWLTGLEIIKQTPVFGVGLGHFGGAVAMNHGLKYVVGINVENTFYMDNYYLKTAVESGISLCTACL
jgi:O-antigen ligase